MSTNDTIVAISSAMTNAGIGIVRISGSNAIQVANQIFKEKNLQELESHTVHYGHIVIDGQVIDEVMLLLLRGPRTYTTEDTVEIDCHGGALVMTRIMEACIASGARPAEPGEFTKRAFLNGRIDLSQAESVMDVISAENEFALQNSIRQLGGHLSEKIRDLRAKILYEIAYIESALDDPEHISLDGYSEELLHKLIPIQDEINELINSSEDGSLLKEGINTAIVGRPNAGKSSLLNVLAGREKAIVTDIPGTTRDILEEKINLSGITLNIIDTAGIRDTDDLVEQIGVERAMKTMEEADFIIYVVDSSSPLDENDHAIIQKLRNRKAIVLLNKSDLKSVITEDEMSQYVDSEIISVSAKEASGIDELREYIKSQFFSGELKLNQEVYITNARHKFALQKAGMSLHLVEESIENGMSEDFFSIDLMDAYTQLGLILGEEVTDDLVDEIFSKFCMGK